MTTADPAIWTGSDTDVAGVLNRAADLIEERGWGTGSWSPDGPLCIEGAIFAAAGIDVARRYDCPAINAVDECLSSRTDKDLFTWNDRLATERVKAAIDAHDWSASLLDMTPVWDEAYDWAAHHVVSVLRAAALIEAAKTTAARTVAPEAELTPVTVAGMAS